MCILTVMFLYFDADLIRISAFLCNLSRTREWVDLKKELFLSGPSTFGILVQCKVGISWPRMPKVSWRFYEKICRNLRNGKLKKIVSRRDIDENNNQLYRSELV